MSDYDAIVIGGGPSGLFAALELARTGHRIALIEKGGDMRASLCPKIRKELTRGRIIQAERYRQQCPRCTCLEGLGGAAFHFDTTLGYSEHLSRSKVELEPEQRTVHRFSGLERALGSFDRAAALVREVFEICFEFGLPPEHAPEDATVLRERGRVFTHVDISPSQAVTMPSALTMIDGILAELHERGADVLVQAPAETIEPGLSRRWAVVATVEGRRTSLEADAVVVGVGKSALRWMQALMGSLDLAHAPCDRADLGVRIETWREDLAPLVGGCHNPKLAFLNDRGESVRTFCVTDGGRLMQYEFDGVPVLEGQHFLSAPTQRTNIGVVTTVAVRDGRDAAEVALDVGRRVAEVGNGEPVVESVGELFGTGDTNGDGPTCSLVRHTRGDLRECLPDHLIDDVGRMIELLNEVSPGCIQPYALLAAPVIERVHPSLELSRDMEASAPGIFLVGDCSSKLIGISYGAATGLAAARAIAAEVGAPR